MNIIEIKNLKLHYKVSGQGKNIILLHGWGCNLDIFDSLFFHLEKSFKVYSIDFQGFGKSEAPLEVWGVEDYTRALEDFVKKLNIDHPVLLGHSFGGRISILYASRNPVNKIILVDAAGVKPTHSLKYYLKVYSFKLSKKLLPLLIGKKRAEERINQYRKKSGSSDYNNATGIMKSILVKVVNEDLKQVMPLIKAPTLLIWGESDTATPLKDARTMNRLIKDSGLAVLKNAGHYSFLEKPYEFNLIVDNFLQKDRTEPISETPTNV